MKTELLSQHDPMKIAEGLTKDEPVVYSENGNRKTAASQFLKVVEKDCHKFGVTRLANISHFSPADFPVFQSTRPNLFGHSKLGQNSGSQGKGVSIEQAKISCIMESLESFCFEPRSPVLIRNSFDFLRKSHFVVSPQKFKTQSTIRLPKNDAQLLWTKAYSVKDCRPVLIPAELAYFPLFVQKYNTESYFFQASNGLASGSSYLEACIHAIHELIERHYLEFYYRNLRELEIEALLESEFKLPFLNNLASVDKDRIDVQVFSLRLNSLGNRNLPTILCNLLIDDIYVSGYGCSSTINISISRAVSEALQGHAASSSGSREDLGCAEKEPRKRALPKFRTLTPSQMGKKVLDMRFKNLKSEFEFLVNWLKQAGFPEIFIVNLTRHGIDIPVVKVVVPGLLCPAGRQTKSVFWPSHYPESLQYNFEQS